MNALGMANPGLWLVGTVVRQEAAEARCRVAEAYHSLSILSAWFRRLAHLVSREFPDLVAALSLVTAVTRQQGEVATAAGWLSEQGIRLTDWDPEVEFRSLDLLEAVDAGAEEILNLAQVLLDAHGILPDSRQPVVLRTAGSLIIATAQLREALPK